LTPSGGAMLKWPPMFLSRSRQKMDGESKSGLRLVQPCSHRCHSKQAGNAPAHEVDTAIDADEGARVHIADQAIVLDG